MAETSPSTTPLDAASTLEAVPKARSEFRRTLAVFFSRPLPVAGLVIIIVFLIITIFGPWLAPYDPYQNDIRHVLAHPSAQHWLGTDEIGRDQLSRLIYGARVSLVVGITVITVSVAIGVILGLVAATAGGFLSNVIMRLTDGLMAFPSIILALMVASLLGSGMKNVIMALTVAMVAPVVRVTCGMALSVKENDYVTAARALGAGNLRIMFLEILPNCFAPILVMATMGIGATILAEAMLSFLGVGITPPTPVWGRMVNDSYKFLQTNPELSFVPGLAIMLVVFGFNMMGDGLRDALDPRLRGVI